MDLRKALRWGKAPGVQGAAPAVQSRLAGSPRTVGCSLHEVKAFEGRRQPLQRHNPRPGRNQPKNHALYSSRHQSCRLQAAELPRARALCRGRGLPGAPCWKDALAGRPIMLAELAPSSATGMRARVVPERFQVAMSAASSGTAELKPPCITLRSRRRWCQIPPQKISARGKPCPCEAARSSPSAPFARPATRTLTHT